MLQCLKKRFSEYRIDYFTEAEYEALFELQRSNPYYFECQQDHELTLDESIRGLTEIPSGFDLSNKHYVGFWSNNRLIAILDYLEHFPNESTVFIGFFMIHGLLKRKGLGTKLMDGFKACAKSSGFSVIRLGCIADNRESKPFWVKQGFGEINRVTTSAGDKTGISL